MEVSLFEALWLQGDRCADDVAGMLGEFDHLGNQDIVPPAVRLGHEPVYLVRKFFSGLHVSTNRIGLDVDLLDVEEVERGPDRKNSVDQFANNGIADRKREQLLFVVIDEAPQNRS